MDGINGYHASGIDEWERSLEKLIVSPELRAKFGANGRQHVEQRYALNRYRAEYLKLLGRLAAA